MFFVLSDEVLRGPVWQRLVTTSHPALLAVPSPAT